MSTHAQVVVAAPNGDLTLFLQRSREVVRHRKFGGKAVHGFKHAVGVVVLLLFYLLLKEVIVLEAGRCNKPEG